MNRVSVTKSGNRIVQLESKGHAGYAEAGEDIVCAGISALMTTCVNALEAVAQVKPLLTADEERVLLRVTLPSDLTVEQEHDAQILLRATILGLTDISREYPRLVTLNILDGRNKP